MGTVKLKPGCARIAKNALIKEQKRRSRFASPDTLESTVADTEFFESFANKEQALQIHRHLHALKEPYREVFMLRVFGELSFKEIADICGKSESWAKVTFYRAKSKLVEDMEGKI